MLHRLLITLLLAVPALLNARPNLHFFAHRGCWSVNAANEFIIPENSIAAVQQAAVMGYEGIECDVKYTQDGKMVIMHDKTINRTMRKAADYSAIEVPVKVEDMMFEELRSEYVLASTNPELRTPIPTLEELLMECKKIGIVPMLHSRIVESYKLAQKIMGDNWVCFDGKFEAIVQAREFSQCTILWSPSKQFINEAGDDLLPQIIRYLEQIGGKCGISTMTYRLYTPEFIKALTDANYLVQASIFPAIPEAEAVKNGITHLLTDRVRPTK